MKIFKISFRNELDLLSQGITKYIFENYIKNNFIAPNYVQLTQNELIGLEYIGAYSINIEMYNFNTENNDYSFSMNGYFSQTSNVIAIRISIDTEKFTPHNYRDFYLQLNILIRHDIEHSFYYKNKNIEVTNDFNDKEDDIIKTVKYNKKYLLEKTEINSNIHSFMLEAKKVHRSVYEIAEIWITGLLLTDKYINRWNKIKHTNSKNKNIITSILNNILLIYNAEITKTFPDNKFK